jgi:acetolactate synthase-1/2/3 large subunit
MGKGVIDESDPRYIGTAALSENDFVHQALQDSDLILMLGHDIVEKPPVVDMDTHKIVHIDFSPADFDDVYTPDMEVIGDISHALWALTENVRLQHWKFDKFYEAKDAMLKKMNGRAVSNDFPLKPQRFVASLRKVMPKDGILSLDNGMYKIWVARNYPAYEQNTVLLDNALATMGAGLGAAMTAKMLFPERKVAVVAGDGGFLMNVADLETAIRLKLDLVIIIVRDDGYGMIKWKQYAMKLAVFGLKFSNPDFVKLAESFGATGHRVNSADEFEKTLSECINKKGIHIIDMPIDYSENKTFGG